MKTLYLIRHAKSSWAFDLQDHDRPLGKRGRKDVGKMGRYLMEHQTPPDVLISSTASRAFYTALHICDQMGIDEGRIKLTKKLFHAGSGGILEVIHNAPSCNTLAIFGHNPGFTSAANSLANTSIENIPTCGVVGISFDIDKWSDAEFGRGTQEFFYYPKGI
ncbi:MAG: histidine phosphatase family protein [Bacteroidota bacterium]